MVEYIGAFEQAVKRYPQKEATFIVDTWLLFPKEIDKMQKLGIRINEKKMCCVNLLFLGLMASLAHADRSYLNKFYSKRFFKIELQKKDLIPLKASLTKIYASQP